jgi:carbamoyltransferase
MRTTFRQIIQYDSKLGHKFVPNQTACLKYGNGTYLIETDKNGFRNSNNKSRKGELKIVCIGDSFTAGDGVSNQYRFTNLLEEKYDCEILNLGGSGYGIDQQLLAYEQYAKDFEHDIVLFFPFLADLERNLLSAREGVDRSSGQPIFIPKPYFLMENGELVLHNSPVPKERETKPIAENNKGKGAEFLQKVLKKTKTIEKRLTNKFNTKILNQTSYPESDDINSDRWKITIPIINKLKELTQEKSLLIFPLPYKKSVELKETSSRYMSIFKRFEDNHTKVYDISETLKKTHIPGKETVFLNICWHFSHSGHELVANEVGNILQSTYGATPISPKKSEDKTVRVLGISCFYHDSAACIIEDGKIIAAAQEERFTRVKHDKSFPLNAINYCLEKSKVSINQVSKIVYYDSESWTIERTLWNSFMIGDLKDEFWNAAKQSLYKKLFLPKIIRNRTGFNGDIFKCQHHISHAAGAFYPSPYKEAAILVIDGVGEWACTTIAKGSGSKIEIIKQQNYPHSLGLLYSAFTYYTGFKVNSGEYKLMGLAPYGDPKYCDIIKDKLITINDDGSIQLNLDYFSFQEGNQMTNSKFDQLFGGPARDAETDITKKEMDLAASIQKVTEEVVIKMANHAKELTNCDYLVMSGGVALNCVANGYLFDNTSFKDIYFQPAAGDAGGAMGCALAWYYENFPNSDKSITENMSAYLGPEFSSDEILAFIDTKNYPYHQFDEGKRAAKIAEILNENLILGYFDGRMEFGPRALGARSIIGNPLNPEMQSKLNLKIKYRESFRPFAPIYLEERTSEYFDFDRPSPHMLIVKQVNKKLLKQTDSNEGEEDLLKIINQVRSEIPAITHVDNSARLQSVNKNQNKRVHEILSEFEKISGKGVLINTSFNVRGEPIVCTPEDAYRCFMRTEMDVLVLGEFFLF